MRHEICNWHLMCAPRIFNWFPIDDLRPRPALGRSQDDHGPGGKAGNAPCAGIILDRMDFLNDRVERMRHPLMHDFRLAPLHEVGFVSVAREKSCQFGIAHAPEYGGIRDLVTVQMEDGKDGAVANWIQELIGVPACRQRTRFGFTIPDDATDQQIWIVKCCTERMRKGVSEFAPFVNRTRSFRCNVARNATGE